MRRRVWKSVAFSAAGIAIAISTLAVVALVGYRPDAKDRLPTEAEVLATTNLPLITGALTRGDIELDPAEVPDALAASVDAPAGQRLAQGFLVGASRVNLYPTPDSFGGTTWQTEGCTDVDSGRVDDDHALPPPGLGWPLASPDCIYLGGFGIGPGRPAEGVGHGGIWVRSIAISNGESTFVYQIADTVGWYARYRSDLCLDCGILDVRTRIASDVGIDVDDIVTASTHTHSGPDTYGGWGGIPRWYRKQIADSAVAGAKQAIANLRPAAIRFGEVHMRERNNERRDTYFSTADTAAAWLQAVTLPGPNGGGGSPFATLGSTRDTRPSLTSLYCMPIGLEPPRGVLKPAPTGRLCQPSGSCGRALSATFPSAGSMERPIKTRPRTPGPQSPIGCSTMLPPENSWIPTNY